MTVSPPTRRLSEFSHGGGCACKLAPGLLAEVLATFTPATHPDLLVGTETGDDAAVWRLDANRALVATTDFFTPLVDDARTWGRIAAVNAVSDVYGFSAENIQPAPEAVGSLDQMFVLGLAKHEDKLVIILDIERLVISSVLGDTKAA